MVTGGLAVAVLMGIPALIEANCPPSVGPITRRGQYRSGGFTERPKRLVRIRADRLAPSRCAQMTSVRTRARVCLAVIHRSGPQYSIRTPAVTVWVSCRELATSAT